MWDGCDGGLDVDLTIQARWNSDAHVWCVCHEHGGGLLAIVAGGVHYLSITEHGLTQGELPFD